MAARLNDYACVSGASQVARARIPSTGVGALGGFMVFVFEAPFGAFDPDPYRAGVFYLLPPPKRLPDGSAKPSATVGG